MKKAYGDLSFVEVNELKHIEGFSKKRVEWLKKKILKEGRWTKPIVIDAAHSLVMDGQHRMEAAKQLKLKRVPCITYRYDDVEVWSLRPNHEVTVELVVEKSLSGAPYPYKTVKHRFPKPILECDIELEQLMGGRK